MLVAVGGRTYALDRRTPVVATRAVVAEVRGMPRALKVWLMFLLALMGVGGLAAVRALFPGDKGIATTPQFEWGLLIVGYVFFAITTSGLCLASSLGTVFGIDRFRPLEKRHAVLALLCLISAFGIIALDLHYPVRMIFGAVFNPSPTSPMWWMGVFYGAYLMFLLVECWSIFFVHERIHRWACVASSATALVAPSTLGAVFGVMAGRAYWAGVFTPLLMLASGFVAGTALLGIIFYAVIRLRLAAFERTRGVAVRSVRLLLVIGLVLVGLLVGREVYAGLNSMDAGLLASTRALTEGPLAFGFVGVRILAGLLVPLVLLILPWPRRWAGGRLLVAAVLSIVGVFADRYTFVSAAQIAPTWTQSGVAQAPYATYSPSLVEIAIVVAAGAVVAFVYTLAERYLDLRESEVHASLLPKLHLPKLRQPNLRLVRARRLPPRNVPVPTPSGGEP